VQPRSARRRSWSRRARRQNGWSPRRGAAQRELTIAEREREQRLAGVRAEVAELAERPREEADEELRVYTKGRRREADRLAQAARRGREAPPS
jgi:hypothetical protein